MGNLNDVNRKSVSKVWNWLNDQTNLQPTFIPRGKSGREAWTIMSGAVNHYRQLISTQVLSSRDIEVLFRDFVITMSILEVGREGQTTLLTSIYGWFYILLEEGIAKALEVEAYEVAANFQKFRARWIETDNE